MLGCTRDVDPAPDQANLRPQQLGLDRLRNQGTVGLVSALEAGKSPVASALLLHHGLEEDRGGGRVPRAQDRIVGKEHEAKARLHVAAAAAIHPTILDVRIEGRAAPAFPRTGRYYVDMAVQDKGTTTNLLRPVAADDVEGVLVGNLDRREARKILDGVHVDPPVIHVEGTLAHGIRHEILCRMLFTAERRQAHQILGEGELFVETVVDTLQNGGSNFLIEHGSHSPWKKAATQSAPASAGRRRKKLPMVARPRGMNMMESMMRAP